MIYIQLFLSFMKIGFTSFGGLSMVPLILEEMQAHGWMNSQDLSNLVAIAEMTPGPLGLNCATFAGMRTGGVMGAAAASVGVLLPSLTLCLIAAIFMERFKESKLMGHALYGIRPVCIGMIAAVVIQQSMANYAGTWLLGMSWHALIIGAVALVLLIVLKWSVPKTITVSAALGLLFGVLFG